MKSLLVLFLLFPVFIFGQYSVENTTITFHDPDRDRNIECGVYYPSIIDTNPGEQQFPYIVFGHGFSMNINPYSFIGEGLVPEGVIVILPNTETGFSPSHEDFAKDLAFIGNHFYQQSLESSGYFHNSIAEDYFIMGHSMGGGSSHLASSFNINPKAVISLAAAETNPSAIEAAEDFEGKVIMFYGEKDNVTPFEEHQEPIFESSASSCKTLIEIIGGVHCYFNNYNVNCWLGEVAVGYNADISREEQQAVVLDLVKLLIQSEMYNESSAYVQFLDSLQNSGRINATRFCEEPTDISNYGYSEKYFNIYPNPAQDEIVVQVPKSSAIVEIIDIQGRVVKSLKKSQPVSNFKLNVSELSNGIYLLKCANSGNSARFIINR